jgi:hypothetical protein
VVETYAPHAGRSLNRECCRLKPACMGVFDGTDVCLSLSTRSKVLVRAVPYPSSSIELKYTAILYRDTYCC